MMTSLQRYRALSADDRRLVTEAAAFLVVVRLGISGVRYSILRTLLGRVPRIRRSHTSGGHFPAVDRVGWAVAAASRRLPFRSTCLVESLAVDAMMRRRGLPSEIRFGVRAPNAGVLTGHAWVECEGTVVFGSLRDYSVLLTRDASDVSNRF